MKCDKCGYEGPRVEFKYVGCGDFCCSPTSRRQCPTCGAFVSCIDTEEDERAVKELCEQLYRIVAVKDLGNKKTLREVNRLRSDLREMNEGPKLEQTEKILSYAAEKVAEQRRKVRKEKMLTS